MYHTRVTLTPKTYCLHGFPLNLHYSWYRENLKGNLTCINGSTLNRADTNRTHCMFSLTCIIGAKRPFYKNITYFLMFFLNLEKHKFYCDNYKLRKKSGKTNNRNHIKKSGKFLFMRDENGLHYMNLRTYIEHT